jgi:hypothetical protein
MFDVFFSETLTWQQQQHNVAASVIMTTAMIISCAHNAARVAMNRAVEFVLIVMFGASVLYR